MNRTGVPEPFTSHATPPLKSRRPLTARVRRRLVILLFFCGLLIAARLLLKSFALGQAITPMPLPYAYVSSPNWDERLPGSAVNCVVLHATVEPTTEGTEQIFLNASRAVSAHFVVGKDGRVVQMVPVEKRAWHAGSSMLAGTKDVNDFSIGIEMVNLNDGRDPYPEAQLQAVAGIIRFLRSRYDIPDARIVSHAQIALPQGRKSDPVGFDFDKIRLMAKQGTPQGLPAESLPERPENSPVSSP